MKLVKFVPAALTALVLTACASSDTPLIAQSAPQPTEQSSVAPATVETLTDASKTVVYSCRNWQTVTAGYAFQGNEARAVNLVLGKGNNAQKLPALTRDETAQGATSFKSDQYVWNIESGFNLENATAKSGGVLADVSSGKVLAERCDVSRVATRNVKQ